MVFEDAGRPTGNGGSYDISAGVTLGGTQVVDTTQLAAAKNQTPYVAGGNFGVPVRWADPDGASGVSGPPANRGAIINHNKIPASEPSACPWSTNNCASLHVGGCHARMGDGAVRFIVENTDTQTIRRLCGPKDGEVVGDL